MDARGCGGSTRGGSHRPRTNNDEIQGFFPFPFGCAQGQGQNDVLLLAWGKRTDNGMIHEL